MTQEIKVMPLGGGRFRVEVGTPPSSHTVSVFPETLERLGWSDTPESLIRRSFEFLLEREPKESILSEFELYEISRYFPDYETEIRAGR